MADVNCAHQRPSDRTQETAALRKARDSSLISAASGKQIQFVGPGDLDSEKNRHKHTAGFSFTTIVHLENILCQCQKATTEACRNITELCLFNHLNTC